MASNMSVKVTGDTKTTEKMIDGLLRAFDPMALSYNFLEDRVRPLLRERADQRFSSGGDEAVGGAWAALRPATVEIRQSKGFGGAGPINVRTGAMKRHVLDSPADVDMIPEVGGTLYFPHRVSGDVEEKMKTAQMGDESSRTVPRPVVGVSPLDMELVLVALGVHIAENQHNAVTGIF